MENWSPVNGTRVLYNSIRSRSIRDPDWHFDLSSAINALCPETIRINPNQTTFSRRQFLSRSISICSSRFGFASLDLISTS
ncbi:hypothetical protein L1987_71848 [Smallanthus sonchifolius]|uniref:Uncharacterized protein n=1 Tax=Smallanthus sonchifolius TaxID=185202 RepID=A0ACB9AUE8_9ASTR|nr:hypothetical protein L1987_71848 [Smallanthus sonchifolius]